MDWHAYLIYLSILSFITFISYGFDKVRAKTGGRRVPEAFLHALALIGVFTGGWLGRSMFRHKTRKRFFTFVLTVSTCIHLGLYYILFIS